jgi:hypothetical protein
MGVFCGARLSVNNGPMMQIDDFGVEGKLLPGV